MRDVFLGELKLVTLDSNDWGVFDNVQSAAVRIPQNATIGQKKDALNNAFQEIVKSYFDEG